MISKHFDKKSFAQLQVDGNIGEVKIQKVERPYADLEKLLANSKDAKKYVTYKTSYRLTAKEFDVVELEEVA